MNTGDILEVEVRAAEAFGLFCRAGEQEVLVLIPETSWVASCCACQQLAAPGDRFRVQVVHVGAGGQVSASIRALCPDPWPSGRLRVGAVHHARVVRSIDRADRCEDGPAHLLELLPGAYAVLCGDSRLEVGAICAVRIVASDFSRRAVRLALATTEQAP